MKHGEQFLDGRVVLHCGDCLDVLKTLAPDSIDSVCCDPPYHLSSIVKRFANSPRSENTENTETPYGRTGRGFMGQRWDGGDIAFRSETWAEVLRVMKPGAHLVACGGTRTYHRLACAIEDAGFEIRDCIQWLYGSGFPKSHDVSKGIDKAARGVPQGGADPTSANHGKFKGGCSDDNPGGRGFGAGPGQFMREAGKSEQRELVDDAQQWSGWGTALKPACEMIVLARKPLSEGTVAANVLKHGTGALNIDGCRVGVEERTYDLKGGDNLNRLSRPTGDDDENARGLGAYGVGAKQISTGKTTIVGRWPANVILDGSDEVVAAFPESNGGAYPANGAQFGYFGGVRKQLGERMEMADSGSAARFFYTSKADSDDRLGSKHPTVKPLDLMQYLLRLITPPRGVCLDLFAGTGTTGEAAFREGMSAVLIEREAEYQADIRRRMALVMAGPDERERESIKAKLKDKLLDYGPLFAFREAAE